MKSSLLISTAAAIVIAAVSASTSAAGRTVLPGFRSPSANIRCFVGTSLYCSIGRADYAAKLQAQCLKPDGSGVDWHGFKLRPTSRGKVYCTSNPPYDTGKQRPRYRLLAYGKSFRHGSLTCISRLAGITCRNRDGHGLFISRHSWRAW
jgi:surface antigen